MLIAEVPKNMNESIRVSINEYKGHKFVDCRVFYEDNNGTWRPTKKGIALNNGAIEDIIKALQKAKHALKGE